MTSGVVVMIFLYHDEQLRHLLLYDLVTVLLFLCITIQQLDLMQFLTIRFLTLIS